MSNNWEDVYADGRRLNRIIKILETKLKKSDDDDYIIRYANSIAYITSKKIEIVDKVLAVKYYIKKWNDKNGTVNPSEKYKIENR